MVSTVLHPDGIDPLQKPRARVDITGEIDPKALPLLLALSAHSGEDIRPIFPQLGRKIHIVLAADHVAVLLFWAGSQGETIQLPVIEIKPLHKIKKELFNSLLINRSRHADIIRLVVSETRTGLLNMLGESRRVKRITSTWAEP